MIASEFKAIRAGSRGSHEQSQKRYRRVLADRVWDGVGFLGDLYSPRGLAQEPLLAVLAFVGAFSPAVAAFIVRKWITHEGFADAKLRLNLRKWPYYLVGWLLPFVVVGCITLVAPLFGFGRADFSLTRGINYMIQMGVPASKLAHPFLLVAIWPIQAIFVAPILFGEEFGWRGYLQPRLFPQSPVLSAVVTGIIWAHCCPS